MICITIAQGSRRLALADMLNASRQGDLLEVRLDCFGAAPDIGELLANKPRPIIFSCRRPQDGGLWQGSETERLALLRQCIVSKADFVEVELDVAGQVGSLPPCRRVVSYTNLQETPADMADIYARMVAQKPDVIKLTTLARSPEEAWPLVQILGKPMVPTVVAGLGKPGIMLTLLAKKIGAPWAYAALERGMEAHPDQPTVTDLLETYYYNDFERATKLLAVTGFGEQEKLHVAAVNRVLKRLDLPSRCLPVGVDNVKLFERIMEAVKAVGVLAQGDYRTELFAMADTRDDDAEKAGTVDVLLRQGDRWAGHHTTFPTVLQALKESLQARTTSTNPFQGRMVMLVGTGPAAHYLATAVQVRGAAAIVTSHDREEARHLAQEASCRHVPFEMLYSTMHDILIVCDVERDPLRKGAPAGVHTGYLREGMTVVDLTSPLRPSPLLEAARRAGAHPIMPGQLFVEQLTQQLKLFTEKEVPQDLLSQVWRERVEAET
jgi:3-dehydroquinate dehydratase/shikimate dehydrogenase